MDHCSAFPQLYYSWFLFLLNEKQLKMVRNKAFPSMESILYMVHVPNDVLSAMPILK